VHRGGWASPRVNRHGNEYTSRDLEDLAGFRDYLFRLGIDISGHSRWGARGSAVDSGGGALLCRGSGSLWLYDGVGRALTELAPMEVGIFTGDHHLRVRLRAVVLGRAAGAFR